MGADVMNAIIFADTDWAVLIPVISTAIVAVVGAIFSGLAMLRSGESKTGIEQVHHEVRTMNELTLGQLGEAQETRRILDKPPTDRTSREQRHTDSAQERSTGA